MSVTSLLAHQRTLVLLVISILMLCTAHQCIASASSDEVRSAKRDPEFKDKITSQSCASGSIQSPLTGKETGVDEVTFTKESRQQQPHPGSEAQHKATENHKTSKDVSGSLHAKASEDKENDLWYRNEATLPNCAEWLYRLTASDSSDSTKHIEDKALSGAGTCFLPLTSPVVLGTDPWHIFTSAKTRSTAPLTARGTADFVAVWQVGPHTPATQPLLLNTFHTYFMNVSQTRLRYTRPQQTLFKKQRNKDGRITQDRVNSESNRVAASDMHLAHRLQAYDTLYGTYEGDESTPTYSESNNRATGAGGVTGRRSVVQVNGEQQQTQKPEEREVGKSAYKQICDALDQLNLALRPLWQAALGLLDRLGVLEALQLLAAEAYANARARCWSSGTAWRRVFYTRQLLVRFRFGDDIHPLPLAHDEEPFYFSGGQNHGERVVDEYAEDLRPLRSQKEIATAGMFSMLRLISFPPVAQIKTSIHGDRDVHYTCSLSAVKSAALVIHADQLKQQQQQQKVRAIREGKPYAAAERYSTSTNAVAGATARGGSSSASSEAAPSRGILIYVINAALSLVRRLFVREDSFYSSSGNSNSAPRLSTATIKTAAPPAVYAARAFLQRVREELGPYQTSAVSSLPTAIQQLIGSRVLNARTDLLLESVSDEVVVEGETKQRKQATYALQWRAILPAGTPMCLAFAALPNADVPSVESSYGIQLFVEESLVFDYLWLTLLLSAWAMWQLKQRLEQSVVARHIVTGLTGIVLLSCMIIFYLLRELQRMSVGKLAVVAALILGGSTAALEGVFSVLWSYYNLDAIWASTTSPDADRTDVLMIAALLFALLFVVNDFLFHLLIPVAQLRVVTRWVVSVLMALVWPLCARQNLEATLVLLPCSAIAIFIVGRLSSVFLPVRWLTHGRRAPQPYQEQQQGPDHFFHERLPRTDTAAAWSMEDPLHEIPEAARQARAYVRPLAVSHHNDGYSSLKSAESRLKKYDEDGTLSTRRALEELAAHLRANPGKYAARLRDPNGVQRWAGGATDDDSSIDVSNED